MSVRCRSPLTSYVVGMNNDPSNPVFLNTKLISVWDTSMAAAVSLFLALGGGADSAFESGGDARRLA